MRPACFLDRDGVLVDDVGYLSDPDDLQLIGDAAAAVRRLNDAGIPVVVVTNQAGIARGFFAESRLVEIHTRLELMLQPSRARIDRIYYCPHHPTAGHSEYTMECTCRKPHPGMLLRAARELELDLSRSFLIGDKLSDLGAGANAGCRTILVRTGYGAGIEDRDLAEQDLHPAHIAADVTAAIDYCLPKLTR